MNTVLLANLLNCLVMYYKVLEKYKNSIVFGNNNEMNTKKKLNIYLKNIRGVRFFVFSLFFLQRTH